MILLSSDLAGVHPRWRRGCSAAPGRHPHPKGRSAAEDGEAVAEGERAARPPPQAGVSFGNRGLSLHFHSNSGMETPNEVPARIARNSVGDDRREWHDLASGRVGEGGTQCIDGPALSASCIAMRCTCCASWLTVALRSAISAASRERTAAASVSGARDANRRGRSMECVGQPRPLAPDWWW